MWQTTLPMVKVHGDCPLGPSPDGVNVRIFRLILSLDMFTP